MYSIFFSQANTLSSRTYKALGVMNNNQIEQHTQMRNELQFRHQLMTNDINQRK